MTNETDKYFALLKAAEGTTKGAALTRLREYTQAHPSVFDDVSILARTTRTEIINGCSTSETTRIHLEGEADALQRGLGIDTATPLERLLIEDVTMCWLRLQAMEQLYTTSYNASGGVTFAKAAYLERRLSATRRRYIQSVESLARVRGLLARIGIQVNIAQQQVVQNAT